ncbi:hypothetical protein [Cryptosporangium aurantiacum]|uniref:Uncharacterized protein n=1 Tax=Cryptosporangium aurantiacum TaxID=134849 RepID=A0A1M7RPK1_9ACTN|nr:hypothetical protein [Cryptosporangium aurantiacum]SHN48194.1 hypothetical protein SAMN05443668_13612 [Cryptosporangium aurantiacum]
MSTLLAALGRLSLAWLIALTAAGVLLRLAVFGNPGLTYAGMVLALGAIAATTATWVKFGETFDRWCCSRRRWAWS